MGNKKIVKNHTWVALSSKVLAVAVVNCEENPFRVFDWAVYIDAVEGQNHNDEFMKVANYGAKQSIEIAKLLFPHIDISKYRS